MLNTTCDIYWILSGIKRSQFKESTVAGEYKLSEQEFLELKTALVGAAEEFDRTIKKSMADLEKRLKNRANGQSAPTGN